MVEDGVLSVVKEDRVRGMVERTYAAVDFGAGVGSIVESNSGQAYMVLFMQYITGLFKIFEGYCRRDDIDIKGDISTFNAVPIYVTDEELRRALAQIEQVLFGLMDQKPSADRKLRTIGYVLSPPQADEQEG